MSVTKSTILEYGPSAADGSASAISLHAHSSCSRESLSFLPRMMASAPLLASLVARQTARYREYYGRDLDFSHTYWRPPMAPRALVDSELRHIVAHLGLRPIVSITDHDTIQGREQLAMSPGPCETPISFEWTLPWGTACFHIGVHNLPPAHAASVVAACDAVRHRPSQSDLIDALEWLQSLPGTLVVLNHPLWNAHDAEAQQERSLVDWLDRYAHLVDALEMNGYRSWNENQRVESLAGRYRLPIVSGGDRHARAPNSVLNLTASLTFADFATEVRRDRRSRVVVMPEYREHRVSRILEAVAEVLRSDPHHAPGTRWVHRVFHITDDLGDLPVARYWDEGEPIWLRFAVGMLCTIGGPSLRSARRLAWAAEPEGAR
jgi:hypothetical protein